MKNLVFIGGWIRDERSYQKLVESAAKDWKIYIFPAAKILSPKDLSNASESLYKQLKEMNISNYYLAGHSLGGALALEFCSQYPDGIKQLILIDSEGVAGQETTSQMTRNFLLSKLMNFRKRIREDIRVTIKNFLSNPQFYIQMGTLAYQINLQNEARKIRTPTLILWAENDTLTPLWQGRKLNQLIRDSKLRVLKQTDHDWILHSPELFWQNSSFD